MFDRLSFWVWFYGKDAATRTGAFLKSFARGYATYLNYELRPNGELCILIPVCENYLAVD